LPATRSYFWSHRAEAKAVSLKERSPLGCSLSLESFIDLDLTLNEPIRLAQHIYFLNPQVDANQR
jgi:hypothetical protein